MTAAAAANRTVLLVALIFLLVFPKSGVYLNGAPVYVLYLLASVLIPVAVMLRVARHGPVLCKQELWFYLLMSPFWTVWVATLLSFGAVSLPIAFGGAFAIIVMPLFCLLVAHTTRALPVSYLASVIKWCVRVVVIFGIVSWLWMLLTGDYLSVPYLTEAGGGGTELWQKNNRRGELFKLVSTYSNGNIFGVCLVVVAPIYFLVERSKVARGLLLAALLLTLSRTVWAATLFMLLLTATADFISRRGRKMAIVFGGVVIVACLAWVLSAHVGGASFVFDSTLGDRSKHLWMLGDIHFMPSNQIDVFAEIPYLSVVYQMGVLGLLTFVIFIFAPPVAAIARFRSSRVRIASGFPLACVVGLMTYCFASFGDAAFFYVPTVSVFMFIFAISLLWPVEGWA
jgi:hypothetical protein